MASAPVPVGMVSYASAQRDATGSWCSAIFPDARYMGSQISGSAQQPSYFNLDFIYDQIPNVLLPFDYDAFAAFPGEVVAVVTNMETGKPEYLPLPRRDRRSTLLRATSRCLPVSADLLRRKALYGWRYYRSDPRGPCPGGRLR